MAKNIHRLTDVEVKNRAIHGNLSDGGIETPSDTLTKLDVQGIKVLTNGCTVRVLQLPQLHPL